MPYSTSKYSGIDFFVRSQAAAICCMSLSLVMCYPFDVFHTRLSADCTKAGKKRVIESTFQCFNRTNLGEGRMGLVRGIEFAGFAAIVRAIFHQPTYDMVKWATNKAGID